MKLRLLHTLTARLNATARHGFLLTLWAWASLSPWPDATAMEPDPKALEEAPRLVLDPEVLDFGELFSGESGSRTLRIANAGGAKLRLETIAFTCSGALSRLKTLEGDWKELGESVQGPLCLLNPGESAELEVRFDSAGLAGEMNRVAVIVSNDGDHEKTVLKLKAMIRLPFSIEPQTLDLGETLKGEGAQGALVVRSAGVGDFIVTGTEGLPSFLHMESERVKDSDPPAWRIDFRLDGSAPAGELRLKVRVTVKNEKVDHFEVLLRAAVLSDVAFHLLPIDLEGVLDLGRFKGAEGARGAIEIINSDPKTPYRITKVQQLCRFSDFIETAVDTLEEGVHYRISLIVKPGLGTRYLQGAVVVFSDHPEVPRKQIKFIGLAE